MVLMLSFVTIALVFAAGAEEGATSAGEPEVVQMSYMFPDTDVAKYPTNRDRPNTKLVLDIGVERFGIDWQLEAVLSSRIDTVFNTRLAARNLPDFVDHRLDQTRLIEVYQQGHIIALNDLVDQYGPTISEWYFEKDPYLLIANGDAEGNLLRFARNTANPQHRIRVLNINLAWLDQLGLDMPETTEELFDALVAFRENDMNKNGSKDEFATGYWVNFNRAFANSFGVKHMDTAKGSFYPDANGKVQHTMLTPEAKEYFAYMARLANANVLDKEIISQTGDRYNAKRYAYRSALFPDAFWGPVTNDSAVRSKGFAEAEYWQMIPPPVAAGVEPTVTVAELPGYNGYMITSGAAYPDRITKMVDWAMTTEGSQQLYYGGTTANPTEYYEVESEYKGYPLAPYSLKSSQKYIDAVGTDPDFRRKMGFQCFLFPFFLYGGAADVAKALENNWSTISGRGSSFEFNMQKLTMVADEIGIPGFAMAAPTAEQVSILEEHSDLFLYIDEMAQKFTIGTESLDEWDNFLAQCERQGLNEVLEVIQSRYDAYVAIMGK